jgi:hypothetical protein
MWGLQVLHLMVGGFGSRKIDPDPDPDPETQINME